MSAWRLVLNVGVILGFALLGAEGCGHGSPAPPFGATIQLGCVPVLPPMVTTTGPCSVCPVVLPNGMMPPGSGCAVPSHSSYIVVNASGAGRCHVELTFGNGATSYVDVDFISIGCESDPHGCGQGFLGTNADGGPSIQVSVPAPNCDAGLDAEASD